MPKFVTLDPHHEKILHALDGHLDHEVFEQCAVELIRQDGWSVVPVIGGKDDGFDGAVADGEGEPFPLISTTGEDLVGNFKKNLKQTQNKGWKPHGAIFATSKDITPKTRGELYQTARELCVTLKQSYSRDWFAYRLYHNPHWCKCLLGVTGRPRSLSVFPLTERPILGKCVIGREREMQWLKNRQGDCLLVGGPGAGKTFLLQSLVKEGQALFVVAGDREQIANDLRELQPPAVIVDDAHVSPDMIRSFDQLRKEIGAEHVRIIATCWTSEVDQVRSALRLADQNVLDLDLIDADTMVKIIKSFGLEGPDRLIAIIREQAAGRPGLAATLVDLCMKDDIQRVVSGEGLVDQLSSQLSNTLEVDVKRLLAPFALGGDAGVNQSEVAEFLGLSNFEISSKLAKLAKSGVIREREKQVLSVEPAPMRWVLVRDIFSRGPGSLDFAPLLDIVESPVNATSTMIWAESRGASIPDLLSHVEWAYSVQPHSTQLWVDYAWLGPSECEYVISRFPALLLEEETAKAGLKHVPEMAIPQILKRVGDAWEHGYKDPIKYLSRWIDDAHRSDRNGLYERSMLVRTAHRWWKDTRDARTTIRALCIALKPSFEHLTTDPGAGLKITRIEGVLSSPTLDEIILFWPTVKEVIDESGDFPCNEIFTLLNDWLNLGRQHPASSEKTVDLRRKFVEQILYDLSQCTRDRPGLQNQLRRCVETVGQNMSLEIDLVLDPVFEAFYPMRILKAGEEEELVNTAAKCLGVRDRSSDEIADTLVKLQFEACLAEIDPGSSRIAAQVCSKLADATEDPVKTSEAFIHRKLPSEWLRPFLLKAATDNCQGWQSVMSHCLTERTYQNLGISIILTLPEPFPELTESALGLAEDFLSLIHELCSLGRVPRITLEVLLRADDRPGVAAAAAIGCFYAEPKGKAELVDERLWRQAILRTVYDDALLNGHEIYGYRLRKILAGDSDLAEEWLLTLLCQGFDGLSFRARDIAAETVIPAMELQQRRKMLMAIPSEWNWTVNEIVRHLVGQDLELYQELLDSRALASYHLAPLMGKPDRLWWMKALFALDAGHSVEDIVRAADAAEEQGWMGSESGMWAEWRRAFQAPQDLGEAYSRILEIARRGTEIMSKREEEALKGERYRAVHGR